jgi:ATP-dependent Clp protease adaptor protein ClpS
MSDIQINETIDIKLDEEIKKDLSEPPKYKVVLLNDDSTPIEFVIQILRELFKHSIATAEQLTMTIHNEGSGIAGVYAYEIAEQKAIEVVNLSRANGFPLQIKVEEDS